MTEPSWLDNLWTTIGDSELAFQIGATWWFPLLESIHVLAVVTLVGVIMFSDLRILGRTGKAYSVAAFVPELTRWGWWMFFPAVLTGLGLFISRPAGYAENIAFQIKIILLLLAGLNVWLLYRRWQPAQAADPPSSYARTAAAISLALWIGVVFAGRWIGHLS